MLLFFALFPQGKVMDPAMVALGSVNQDEKGRGPKTRCPLAIWFGCGVAQGSVAKTAPNGIQTQGGGAAADLRG